MLCLKNLKDDKVKNEDVKDQMSVYSRENGKMRKLRRVCNATMIKDAMFKVNGTKFAKFKGMHNNIRIRPLQVYKI